MNKRGLVVFVSVLFLFSFYALSVTAQDYLALQGSANGSNTASGNVSVEIWSAATGGSLLYNSSTDFLGQLNNSRYDILLGNGTQPLSLNFSMTYYMDLVINARDIDFNGSERQVFQSPVGNITVNDPIKTTSTSASALNINDLFNVSGSNGNTISGGTLQITNSDVDDVINVTIGGVFIAGNTVFNRFFNITTTTSAVRTNGTITILSTADPALNINNVFNISGSNGNTVTSGTLRLDATSGIVLDVAGPVVLRSTDVDDALNVTSGVTIAGKTLFTNTDTDDAVNFTLGGLAVRGGTLSAYYGGPGPSIGITSTNGVAFSVNQGFNISGADEAITTNGTITVTSGNGMRVLNNVAMAFGGTLSGPPTTQIIMDSNNILNITGSIVVFDRFFNITPATSTVRTNGTITILSTDNDDALNVTTGSMAIHTGNLTIGNNATQNQHHLDIGIPGSLPSNSNKCSYILLLDESGNARYLFFGALGELRMANATPSTCSEGLVIGGQ